MEKECKTFEEAAALADKLMLSSRERYPHSQRLGIGQPNQFHPRGKREATGAFRNLLPLLLTQQFLTDVNIVAGLGTRQSSVGSVYMMVTLITPIFLMPINPRAEALRNAKPIDLINHFSQVEDHSGSVGRSLMATSLGRSMKFSFPQGKYFVEKDPIFREGAQRQRVQN
ncbi:hypothetical protein E2C01_041614 [Portunus trituberculatus]|uniref:Uncharacterized protein n=1 Tax=Portunus trituberculatus TaxID=210409 RepID=A0A5B7FR44_PORTR|nr:hypothetical protein [Portunus trituberculatus]